MEAVNPSRNSGFLRKLRSNFMVYIITLVVVCAFAYFILKYIYAAPTFQANLILSSNIVANNPKVNAYNVAIPNIYDGGEFSTNFWVYISGYTYHNGQRKHLVEIGHQNTTATNGSSNFSTIVIALGATTPTLLVRVHTKPSDSAAAGMNYGITDCSGADDGDCSGGSMIGFQKLTDTNLQANKMMDNQLYIKDVKSFFTPYNGIDENNSMFNSSNTCDVKELPLQKWVNICTVMNGKTLDIYLDGKLVKTCVFNNYFKVDSTGTVVSYLQNGKESKAAGGFDGFFSRLQVFNTSLRPDDIYKNYLAGPTGSSATSDPVSFIKYLFTG